MNIPRPETPKLTPDTATRKGRQSTGPFEIGATYGYFTPLELVGRGGMGSLLKVQIHRDDFVAPYVASHILSGDLPLALLGIRGRYEPDDPEFEAEVWRRVRAVERTSFLFQRMREELEKREDRLVKAGYIAAIKVPSTDDAAIASRFFREVRILHNMGDHPHIVKYIACDAVEGRLILIMEYFPSQDLSEVIYASKLSTEWALGAFVAVLKAVHHAHSKGVIHRDIKPSNILTDGTLVKITDFGLAKPLSPELERTQLTLAQQVIGTPAYMAPEQIDPALGEIGEWTDIYQLGLTLFEMLTQRPLYDEREYRKGAPHGSRDTSMDSDPKRRILETVGNVGRRHPHFPRDFDPTIPDEVEKLTMTLCQKDVLERYTCELALEHAEELIRHKLFVHAEPQRPPSDERKKESRTTLILSASEALLAKRAYEETEAYEKGLSLVTRAEKEADFVARLEYIEQASESLGRLPRAKFSALHERLEALAKELEAMKDDVESFRPNRKIALEIVAAADRLSGIVESDAFYETAASALRQKVGAVKTRAEQHLERIKRTGLPEKIVGKYVSQLERILWELPKLEEAHRARKETFVRKKMEELDSAIRSNPDEAPLLISTLRRALAAGEADDLTKALLAELEAKHSSLPDAEPPASPT